MGLGYIKARNKKQSLHKEIVSFYNKLNPKPIKPKHAKLIPLHKADFEPYTKPKYFTDSKTGKTVKVLTHSNKSKAAPSRTKKANEAKAKHYNNTKKKIIHLTNKTNTNLMNKWEYRQFDKDLNRLLAKNP